ncbi:MAG: cob(I)yrinic acid a,c-diamide adenosyltransferase [Firmicutes bacterium]|nr:cob(I)yrinic acid a,c-diamide adenosyltransferase [Bacillota bacterium]
MKIYTRTGDQGATGLFGGQRVSKDHVRLEAYGTLDELNSVIGLVRLHVSEASGAASSLVQIQNDLFALGAFLATPADQLHRLSQKMTRPTWAIAEMEADIDRLTALAPPMRNFVLPGGQPASAHAHWARTVCRRAERRVVTLAESEQVPAEVLIYLNRLSDWLFALARAENALSGAGDVEWLAKA